ncbi:hypothetical protein [Sorangium sp. So ce542]|uniref:hypothetical protein n=1 Tax=Sorangium sp. So ce542 TaxID=3133316 RepID=UPI003F6373BD
MAKRKRAAWLWATWACTAGGCATVAGLEDSYYVSDGEGGASASTGSLSSNSGTWDTMDSTTGGATSAGTGGGGPVIPEALESIDDMEDNDNAILAKGGRIGYWYTFNDGTEGATQNPPPDTEGTGENPFTMTALDSPRGRSIFAARSWGSGFEVWGAGLGFDLLNSPEGAKAAYDASAYTGITFWAKIGAGSTASASVTISDRSTDPAGGVCSDLCDAWQESLSLTEEWQQFTLPFADMNQGGWGDVASTDQLDATQLFSIRFQVYPESYFDLYIDDISFITAE